MKLNRLFIGTLVVFTFLFMGTAHADILDDIDSSFFTGVTFDGENNGGMQTILKNTTIFTPEGQAFLGIPMDWAELKLIQLGGLDNSGDSTVMLSEFTYAARLWESDDYFLSIKQIDEPVTRWGGGGIYSITNLDEDLPPFLIGIYLMDKGGLLYTLRGDWQFTTGYFLGCDLQYGTNDPDENKQLISSGLIGDIHLKHNLKPTGEFYGEVGAMSLNGKFMMYGGVGGFF